MRQKSLVATAAVALLAGTVFASAQGMQKQVPGGGAMERGAPQGQEHSPGAASSQGEERNGQRHRNRAQVPQKEPAGTVGQGQQAEPKAHESEPKISAEPQRPRAQDQRTGSDCAEGRAERGARKSCAEGSPGAAEQRASDARPAHRRGRRGHSDHGTAHAYS